MSLPSDDVIRHVKYSIVCHGCQYYFTLIRTAFKTQTGSIPGLGFILCILYIGRKVKLVFRTFLRQHIDKVFRFTAELVCAPCH